MKPVTDKMVIRIKSDFSVSVDSIEEGVTAHKIVTPEEIMGALSDSVKTEMKFASGLLPKNCIHFSVNGNQKYIVIEHKERYTDMYYYKTEYKNFPLPRLLYGFKLNRDNKITGVNLGVVEDKAKLTENTKMYKYPFSNVSSFGMCIGANAIPPIKNLSALVNIPYYLFTLPDNDDHYNSNNNRLNLEHRELLETLKDKKPEFYYSDVLIESGQTLKNFL